MIVTYWLREQIWRRTILYNREVKMQKNNKPLQNQTNIPKSDFFFRETRADDWITEEMREVDIIYLSWLHAAMRKRGNTRIK